MSCSNCRHNWKDILADDNIRHSHDNKLLALQRYYQDSYNQDGYIPYLNWKCPANFKVKVS